MPRVNVQPEYKNIVKMFEELSGSKHLWQTFSDVIECIAISIQNQFTFGKKWTQNENRYKEIMNHYTQAEQEIFPKIYAKIVEMLEENPYRDLLGSLYMQLDMGDNGLGQFFTPYSVCQCMASSVVSDEMLTQDLIRLSEPSCGGGANIISVLEVLHKNGINYQQKVIVACQDLSRIPALMCYIVLAMMGCQAVIKVGDTLLNPYTNYYDERSKNSEIWTTPMFHINNCYSKI